MDEVRRANDLLRAYDSAGKALESIELEIKPFVRVELYCRDRGKGDDDDEGTFDYDFFRAPRDLVIKMLKALRVEALAEMRACGIET